MASKLITVSDLSGAPDAFTTTIGRGDELFDLDVTRAEEGELDAVLAPYLKNARRREAPRRSAKAKVRVKPETTPAERQQVRDWAWSQGHEVSRWGQIPNRILGAYRAQRDADGEAGATAC